MEKPRALFEVLWKLCRAMSRAKRPVYLLTMAALTSIVSAHASFHQTEKAVGHEYHQVRCSRRLVTTVWGCIVTLLALGLDSWGRYRHTVSGKVDTVIIFVLGALNPFISFWGVADDAVDYVRMLTRLEKPLLPSCFPWGQCVVKIIVPSDVIINGLSQPMYEKLRDLKSIYAGDIEVHDFSNAIVIGGFKEELVNFIPLSLEGKEALLRANVLPTYDDLKKLHGHSRLGVVLSFIQAIGYIYGVVFRSAEGLHVSPVEVICLVLNLLLLMKVGLHHFSSFLHKPLVLHLDADNQERFWKECQKIEHRFVIFSSHLTWCVALSSLGFAAILISFIAGMAKHLDHPQQIYFPLILFLLTLMYTALALQTLVLGKSKHSALLELLIYVLNGVSYISALAVTGKFWIGKEFNVRSSHDASELFPHIG
ncbi:hypothetical protein KC19_1G002500 [Ceratodon purpureus]|uniref:Uncharacterized protein n=1 Tax=Ceratodon purpureus TaxID=3225 RepID=A0A8T0IZP4_CERPU|nr:hypothetical protein KC19_1G002500 [Ceratodon purpureus]